MIFAERLFLIEEQKKKITKEIGKKISTAADAEYSVLYEGQPKYSVEEITDDE